MKNLLLFFLIFFGLTKVYAQWQSNEIPLLNAEAILETEIFGDEVFSITSKNQLIRYNPSSGSYEFILNLNGKSEFQIQDITLVNGLLYYSMFKEKSINSELQIFEYNPRHRTSELIWESFENSTNTRQLTRFGNSLIFQTDKELILFNPLDKTQQVLKRLTDFKTQFSSARDSLLVFVNDEKVYFSFDGSSIDSTQLTLFGNPKAPDVFYATDNFIYAAIYFSQKSFRFSFENGEWEELDLWIPLNFGENGDTLFCAHRTNSPPFRNVISISLDSGKTFNEIPAHGVLERHFLDFDIFEGEILLSTPVGFYLSKDQGNNFEDISKPGIGNQIIATQESRVFTLNKKGFFHSENLGSWERMDLEGHLPYNDAGMKVNNEFVYVTFSDFIQSRYYRFDKLNGLLIEGANYPESGFSILNVNNDFYLAKALNETQNQILYTSSDAGLNWTAASANDFPIMDNYLDFEYKMPGEAMYLAGYKKNKIGLFKSENEGVDWMNLTNGIESYDESAVKSVLDFQSKIFIVVDNYERDDLGEIKFSHSTAYREINGNFVKLSLNFDDSTDLNIHKTADKLYFSSFNEMLELREDSFFKVSPNLPGWATVSDINLIDGQLWVTTLRNGIWRKDVLSSLNNLELSQPKPWDIFPNPVDDVLYINCYNPTDLLNVEIFNLQGQLLYERELNIKENIITIPLDSMGLLRGNYVVTIRSKTGEVSSRLFNKN